MRWFIVPLMVVAALSGCAGRQPLGGDARTTVVDANGLPEPTRADLATGTRPYLIGPFDKLSIDVFGVPDLTQKEVQTDASGRISFPLVGVVEAAGKTPAEVATILEDRLRHNFIRDPQVTVNLKETVSQVVTVDGEVAKPGLYPVLGRMTLIRAVATASGTSEFAKLDDVVVFREVGGHRYAALYDLQSIRRGAYADPEIFPNDVVIVGDSPARRLFKTFMQAAPALASPLVLLLQ